VGARTLALIMIAAAAAGGVVLATSHGGGAKLGRAGPPSHQMPIVRKPRPSPAGRPLTSLVVSSPVAERALRLRLTARAAILVDARSGWVLWALRPHRRLPIASTTKIMTALIALERLRPRAVVRVDGLVTRVPLVREGLRAHERVRAWKLLDGLLIYSGNDDALALAIASGGTRGHFIALMNEQARTLGLRDTQFSSPSGVIDTGNFSSAWDLAALTRYALGNARFRAIVRTRIVHVPWSAPTFEKVYVNKNALLGAYPGADGVKTGWTTVAGPCLVASATRNGRTLIAVLLHDGNDYADARRLLNLGFRTVR
jgi:D-alanyl-D-alanine carboxypeptidase